MDAIVKQKIDKYVNNAFTAAHLKANEAAQIEMANARAKMAKMGLAAPFTAHCYVNDPEWCDILR